MTGTLILVRHGESEWNLKNLFTGWRNPDLTEKGIGEAKATGKRLKAAGYVPDVYFTSALRRAQHTLDLILDELGITEVTITRSKALNERDYGELSGLNKDDARKKWGEEQVHIWRRSYDVPPPGGESLKDTAARTLPYYDAELFEDQVERMLCPPQRRGVEHRRHIAGGLELLSRLARLFDALLGEVRVAPAGEQILEVPLALPVAHEDQRSGHTLATP